MNGNACTYWIFGAVNEKAQQYVDGILIQVR